VKPGKCSLSIISAAITYSAWWKEIEQVKARGKRKPFLNGFWPVNYSSGKLGLRLLAVFAFRGFGGVKPKRKKNTGVESLALHQHDGKVCVSSTSLFIVASRVYFLVFCCPIACPRAVGQNRFALKPKQGPNAPEVVSQLLARASAPLVCLGMW
jgi:hypothetical protein